MENVNPIPFEDDGDFEVRAHIQCNLLKLNNNIQNKSKFPKEDDSSFNASMSTN